MLNSPIPITIISGFLGAGKTTLLNNILSGQHGFRVAVLVNDFGAINIDAKLVVSVDGDTINLDNGCICCNIRGDLIRTCLKLLQQSQLPDYIIIETSGLSDPVEVANTFLIPELYPLLRLNCILAVVDGELFPQLPKEMAMLARKQLLAADMLVLNKGDLVTREELTSVKTLIRQIVPQSRILEAYYAQIPLELILSQDIKKTDFLYSNFFQTQFASNHGQSFTTWNWTCDRPLSLAKLRSVFEKLPDQVFRAKGIVYLEELPSYRVALQMVGKRSNLRDIGQWGAERPKTEIVMIFAQGEINTDSLQTSLENCIRNQDESISPTLSLARKLGISETR